MESSDGLRARRSYVKGVITRIAEFCRSDTFNFATDEVIEEKKRRLIKAFEDYEAITHSILNLEPSDNYNHRAIEDAFDSCFIQLSKRQYCLRQEVKVQL